MKFRVIASPQHNSLPAIFSPTSRLKTEIPPLIVPRQTFRFSRETSPASDGSSFQFDQLMQRMTSSDRIPTRYELPILREALVKLRLQKTDPRYQEAVKQLILIHLRLKADIEEIAKLFETLPDAARLEQIPITIQEFIMHQGLPSPSRLNGFAKLILKSSQSKIAGYSVIADYYLMRGDIGAAYDVRLHLVSEPAVYNELISKIATRVSEDLPDDAGLRIQPTVPIGPLPCMSPVPDDSRFHKIIKLASTRTSEAFDAAMAFSELGERQTALAVLAGELMKTNDSLLTLVEKYIDGTSQRSTGSVCPPHPISPDLIRRHIAVQALPTKLAFYVDTGASISIPRTWLDSALDHLKRIKNPDIRNQTIIDVIKAVPIPTRIQLENVRMRGLHGVDDAARRYLASLIKIAGLASDFRVVTKVIKPAIKQLIHANFLQVVVDVLKADLSASTHLRATILKQIKK
ncbi:hypothetical protein EBR96_01110 [bacterium]|nr:hypothetical protein [bacterium]